MGLELPTLLLLVVAAFVAGFVDSIAGGGGLLTVPALLSAGLPPHVMLGTNKGQAVFGVMASVWRFARAGLITRRLAWVSFPLGFAGSLFGAFLVTQVSPDVLRPLVIILLIAAAAIVVFRPAQKTEAISIARPVQGLFVLAPIALFLGTYDGFFGPGTGTFLILAYVLWGQMNYLQASAQAKVVNFASNVAAVAWFQLHGQILWLVALPMALAQFTGSTLGAMVAIKRGQNVIRAGMFFVVLVLIAKLGYSWWF